MSVFILICFHKPVHAQIGIKAGTTLSSFYYPGGTLRPDRSYEVDLRPYLGYDAGLVQTGPQKPLVGAYISVYRLFGLTTRLALRPELSFLQKGVNFSRSDYEKIRYAVRINYLEIPLSLTWQFLRKEKDFSDLCLGGYGAYRISALKVVGTHADPAERTRLDAVRDFDWGLHFGLGYKRQISKNALCLDLRFFLGLTDILQAPEEGPGMYFDTHKTKITGFNVSLGYEL